MLVPGSVQHSYPAGRRFFLSFSVNDDLYPRHVTELMEQEICAVLHNKIQ